MIVCEQTPQEDPGGLLQNQWCSAPIGTVTPRRFTLGGLPSPPRRQRMAPLLGDGMLVNCQRCGNAISDKAVACPKCSATGDAAFGNLTSCMECDAPFRSSWKSCQSCGAPVVTALGKVSADELAQLPTTASLPWTADTQAIVDRVRRAGSDEPDAMDTQASASMPPIQNLSAQAATTEPPPTASVVPNKVRSKPPGFARGSFGKAMAYVLFVLGVFSALGAVTEAARLGEFSSLLVSQLIGAAGLLVTSLRAIGRRLWRTTLDLFLAAYLFLVCVGAISTMRFDRNFAVADILFLIFFSALVLVPICVVGIRLLRQPFNEPRESGSDTRGDLNT